jgi:hypothetical protein
MTNTMSDLRKEVARRLRDTLHGREIDTMKRGKPEVPHMLGVVTLGAISTPEAESGTILDPDHGFWSEYYDDVKTKNGVLREIQSAMHSLKEDNIFRVTTPYGEDAGIMYVEVDEIAESPDPLSAACKECGTDVMTEMQISLNCNEYSVIFNIDCPNCAFEADTGLKLDSV